MFTRGVLSRLIQIAAWPAAAYVLHSLWPDPKATDEIVIGFADVARPVAGVASSRSESDGDCTFLGSGRQRWKFGDAALLAEPSLRAGDWFQIVRGARPPPESSRGTIDVESSEE